MASMQAIRLKQAIDKIEQREKLETSRKRFRERIRDPVPDYNGYNLSQKEIDFLKKPNIKHLIPSLEELRNTMQDRKKRKLKKINKYYHQLYQCLCKVQIKL